MARINCIIGDEEKKKLKMLAARTDTTISSIINRLLLDYFRFGMDTTGTDQRPHEANNEKMDRSPDVG